MGPTGVAASARHLGRLIADLESLAYADAAVLSLDRCPPDLAELVQAAVTEFAGPYAAEGLRRESSLTAVEADVDPVRIRQAVSNLLSNSLKFTPDGGRVLVEVAPEDDVALIRVTDSGSGIADDELPRVFDRCFRGRVPGRAARESDSPWCRSWCAPTAVGSTSGAPKAKVRR